MYLRFDVVIPTDEKGISRKKIKGTTYVYYEYARKYKADKKYNVPQCTSIGKVCEEDSTRMIPNGNYLKYFPDADLPEEFPVSSRSGCLKIGSYLMIQKVIQYYQLDAMISEIVGKNAGLFLDLAAYAIVTENNASQYYPEYAYNHPLFTDSMRIYSDSKISKFLHSLSRDVSLQFQNEWNENRDHREKIYISYDSTNKHCQAGEIELAEFGHEKEKLNKPIFNFTVAYDRNNRIPLFYENYLGSINDVSQLQFSLEKAAGYGYKRAGFILDRGYFSEGNIRYMDQKKYDFIIMVKGCKSLVNEMVKEVRGTFEDEWECSIPFYGMNGTTVKRKLFPSDEKERYFHIYYCDYNKAKERNQLETKIRSQREELEALKGSNITVDKSYLKYFDLVYYHEGKADQKLQAIRERKDVISGDIKLCGYFAIVTSEEMSAKDALVIYKSRDCSEKLFRGDKSYLGEKNMRVYEAEPFYSKIFIEFVALIIRNKIYTCLKDRMKEINKKPNYMTVPAALRELDKIEMLRQGDGIYRLDHAITATQKDILQAFNLTAANVKKSAMELSKQLTVIG